MRTRPRAVDEPERAKVPGGRSAHEARGLQAGEGHTPLSIGLRPGPPQAAPQPQPSALRRPTGQRPMGLAQRGGAAPEEAPRAGHGGPTTAQSTGAVPPRASGPAGRARRRTPLRPSSRAARPPLLARRRGPPLLARRAGRGSAAAAAKSLRSRAALWHLQYLRLCITATPAPKGFLPAVLSAVRPDLKPFRGIYSAYGRKGSPKGFLPAVLSAVRPDLKPFRGVHPAGGRKGGRQAGKSGAGLGLEPGPEATARTARTGVSVTSVLSPQYFGVCRPPACPGRSRRRRPGRQLATGLGEGPECGKRDGREGKSGSWRGSPSDCHWPYRPRNEAGRFGHQPDAPVLGSRAQPGNFTLGARGFDSPSELRILPVLEKTVRCTNYRTDPVRV